MKVKPFNLPLKIVVEVQVNPSEDANKVRMAIQNLIKYIEPNFSQKDKIIASTNDEKSLYLIYEQIRAKQILAVARRLLLANMAQDNTYLILNKQAAFMGSLNICEEENESPLGPIKLIIQSPYINEFIDWLAPS
ncbi:MAG: RNA-binding domain-containing protein [Nitrososphaerales archaeon]